MKILFAGTPEFAVAPLEKLHNDYEIVGVFTQPDRKAGRGKKLTPPPVKIVAEKLDIPVFQPTSLKDQQNTIRDLGADIMVVVAYGMLLPQSILDIPRLGCLNIHASILPRWRGAAPIQRAIESGDTETGVSIMKMELGLDTGPVYQVLKTPILKTDTSASMHDKLAQLGAQGISETIKQLIKHPNLEYAIQDDSQANYAKKITKQQAIIDWHSNAVEIDQRIRAFTPWPICQTNHNETRIRVWKAQAINDKTSAKAGEIVSINENSIDIACGEGSILRLLTLQRDGSKQLPISEFCNGYPLKLGDTFSSHDS